jgi:hypothetical protein
LHKLEYRSKPCIFLGYSYTGYKCLDSITNQAYLSKNVIFNEDFFPAKDLATTQFSSKINAQDGAPLFLPISIPLHYPLSVEPNTSAATTTPDTESAPLSLSASSDANTIQSPIRFPASTSITSQVTSHVPIAPSTLPHTTPSLSPSSSSMPTAPSTLIPPTHTMVTKSQIGSLKPKTFLDYHLHHTELVDIEPVTYRMAATDSRWMEAMQQEFDALLSNKTWTLCSRPSHHNVIANKWVFKIK